MKSKLRIRNIFLLICSFTLACVVALAGVLHGKTKRTSAENATTTYTVSDFFRLGEGARFSERLGLGSSAFEKDEGQYNPFPFGYAIVGDQPYSAEIVPTFTDNFSTIFKFPVVGKSWNYANKGHGGDNNGDFKFYFTDVEDESNYFIVHYTSEGNVQVEYPAVEGEQDVLKVVGTLAMTAKFHPDSTTAHFLDLTWSEDGILDVIVSFGGFGSSLKSIATFDGTEKGLPKISFPKGYKVSFASDWVDGTDVTFKTVLGATIRDASIAPSEFRQKKDPTTGNLIAYKAEEHIEKTWKNYDPTFHFTAEDGSVTFPATATSVITYNGVALTDGCTVNVPYNTSIDRVYSAVKYDDMYFPTEKLTVSGTLNTTEVDASAKISVSVGGTKYTYDFVVAKPTKPALRLVGIKPTLGYVAQTIPLPKATTDAGNPISVTYVADGIVTPKNIENYTLVPETTGTHKITYAATNADGVTTKESFSFIVTADIEKPVITVDYEDEYAPQGEYVTIPLATATDNSDGVVEVIPKVTLGNKEIPVADGKFMPEEVGDYTLSLTATDVVGNVQQLTYTVYVLPAADFKTVNANAFVSLQNASARAASTTSFNGLGVTSNTRYTGKFNVLFEGNKEIAFKFSERLSDAKNYSKEKGNGDFYFKIANADDPEDYFTVHYEGKTVETVNSDGTTSVSGSIGVYVVYKGQKRYCDSAFLPKEGTVGVKDQRYTSADISGFHSYATSYYNKLGLEWKGDVLSVVNSEFSSSGEKKVTVAKFDGTGVLTKDTFKLPKIEWKTYTVEFGSDFANTNDGDAGTDVLFLGFKGKTDFFTATDYRFPVSKRALLYDGKLVEDGDTISIVKGTGLGDFHAAGMFNGFSIVTRKLKTDTTFDPAQDEQEIRITYEDKTFAYTLRQLDDIVAPMIQLNNGVSSTQIIDKNAQLTPSFNDIVAYDDSCGKMQASALSILVKKEGDADFQAYAANYVFTEGKHILRYLVIDGSGNQSYLDRTVIVINEFIGRIVVGGEIPTVGYVKHSFQVPTATFEGAQVSYNVIFNGEQIQIANGKIDFTEAGTYEISYYTADLKAQEVFTITVIEDKVCPEITVNFSDKAVLVGTTVTLPTATATDAVDGALSVTCRVTYGTQETPIVNGGFLAEGVGAYTVTFTAADISGNVVRKRFIVQAQKELLIPEVSEEETDDNGVQAENQTLVGNGSEVSKDSQNDAQGNAQNSAAENGGGCSGSVEGVTFTYLTMAILVVIAYKKRNLIKRRK